ncbi:MAG: family 10 glycosylhydrolase [Kiritimatiellaeota bacterium]|nr:family 10 glycosylhydrolase [Kiritimatiellota bacterium]
MKTIQTGMGGWLPHSDHRSGFHFPGPALAFLVLVCGVRSLSGVGGEVFSVVGNGVGDKPRYKGGGKLEFRTVSVPVQLVHFSSADEVRIRLDLEYKVIETAPILLTSRFGTEYWRLMQYRDKSMVALYTDEKIDLSRLGPAVAHVNSARVAERYGARLHKGLSGFRGHYYFLIDQPSGEWLDVTDPPALLQSPNVTKTLLFTLADLSRYTLGLGGVQSTWKPGGPVRVRIEVTDAAGERFPVVNVPAALVAGDVRVPLVTQFDWIDAPTGWMVGRLPNGALPESFDLDATVRVLGPSEPEIRRIHVTVTTGTGTVSEAVVLAGTEPASLPRTADGRVRETRALWVAPSDIRTRADIRKLVNRAVRARLNVLIPDVFVRSSLLLKSSLFPLSSSVENGLDPLGFLTRTAHAHGLEVHPWFCVTYRDARFRKSLPGVDMIDRNGKVIKVGADVHRPEYRDFIVDLMVGTARDYPIDGIHLDYIRAMNRCWCAKCRAEFTKKFGKPLENATAADWVEWQRAAIGDIVRRTAEGVRKVRPRAVLSAAVFSNLKAGAEQGQDPAAWLRKGWLDMVIPMDYKMQTLLVYTTEAAFLDILDDDDRLVTGLSLYRRSGGRAVARPSGLVRQQIRLVRRMGIHGYCLFASPYLDDAIVSVLREDLNRLPAVPFYRTVAVPAGLGRLATDKQKREKRKE